MKNSFSEVFNLNLIEELDPTDKLDEISKLNLLSNEIKNNIVVLK